jgi:plasmid stabilization system protein ParE
MADMQAIARYFDTIDPDVTLRIVADVERAIERLRDFPSSGEPIRGTGLRRVTSKRYRFAIRLSDRVRPALVPGLSHRPSPMPMGRTVTPGRT